MRHRIATLAAATVLALTGPAIAQGPAPVPALSADTVAARAAAVSGGDDGAARISFVLEEPDRKPVRLDYALIWKRYPEGPYETKVIFFPEFPPDRKGFNWLGFLARAGAGGEDEAWIFLPNLHTVRRVQSHDEADEEDPFHRSLLTGLELLARPPSLDHQRLLGSVDVDGRPAYVLESTRDPKVFPYPRTVRWIAYDDYLTLRAEHFTPAGRLARRVSYTWKRVGKRWVWDTVTAVDPDSGAQTRMSVSDQRVDVGLADRWFSEATLRNGPDRFLAP